MEEDLNSYAAEEYCYLTTTGRVSGRRHEIEIWFALDGSTVYMLARKHGSDWGRNIQKTPDVTVHIRARVFAGRGRVVPAGTEEDITARTLVGPKYREWQPGQPQRGWTWTALPVAVDLDP